MELSCDGLTSWGHRYEWYFGGSMTLYHDNSDSSRRLVTHLNTRAGLPFEDEYMDNRPVLLSPTEREEWDALCHDFLIREQDIYNRMLEELRWHVNQQVGAMYKEDHNKRVISTDEYDLFYSGARDAVASALSVPDEDIDIINYEEGANVIDLWLGDLFEAEGYTLENSESFGKEAVR